MPTNGAVTFTHNVSCFTGECPEVVGSPYTLRVNQTIIHQTLYHIFNRHRRYTTEYQRLHTHTHNDLQLGHSMLFQPPSHIDHLGLCSKIYYWLLWIPNERIPSYSVQLKLVWKLRPFKIWVPRPLFDNLFKRWRL